LKEVVMRYLVGFVCVLAGLVALPLSASAQDGEEGATPEPSLHEPAASTEPAPEEPALRLELNDDSVKLAPSPPPTVDGYTLEEMDRRVRRAKIGFGASGGVYGAGVVLLIVAAAGSLSSPIVGGAPEDASGDWVDPAFIAGGVLAGAGVIASYTALGIWVHRKRQLRELQQAHYGTPRRVQWDLARSRLVF
jgi:hypothetical protein